MLELRPYQKDALVALNNHLCTKDNNPCVVVPTGGGKSVIIAEAIKRWGEGYKKFRCAIIAHRKELVTQNFDEFCRLYYETDFNLSNSVGTFCSALKKKDYDANILFASIGSIYRKAGEFEPFDVIIIDEAHRIPIKGEGQYLSFLRESKKFNSKLRVVGFTATPFRMSCGPICHKNHLLNEICYEVNLINLINDGYLCKLRSKVGSITPDTSKVRRNHNGDYITNSLSAAVNGPNIVEQAVEECSKILNAERRRSTVFFCVDIGHCSKVSEALRGRGIVAPVVTSKTKQHERDLIARDFKNGKLRAICNVNVYTEGFNAACIDCIVLLRPTLSKGLFCLDMDTEILSKRGWKTAGEISIGDKVAGFNIETQHIELVETLDVYDTETSCDDKFVSLETPNTSIRVTDNHRMIFHTRRSDGWRIKLAKDIAQYKDGVYLPKAGYYDFPGCSLSDDEIRFVGWVMTDGSINKTTGGICITQSTKQPWFSEIKRVLESCEFKYGSYVIKNQTQFTENAPRIAFTISKGMPRGRGRYTLRGWAHIEPWLSKDFSLKLLNEMDHRQFEILLEAVHLGDGSKQAGQSWTRRSYHIFTGNKTFAGRLQLCCVLHGFRATISEQNSNSTPLYVIHIKKTNKSFVGSVYDDRPTFKEEESNGERVWCISNKLGSIITKRNGKVTILGNSQMVGRGLRLSDNKRDCLVLDFARCIEEHGPIDQLDEGSTIVAICGNCREVFSRAIGKCPNCDWIIPKREIDRLEKKERERRMHGDKVSDKSILSSEPETYKVDDVYISRYTKNGSPDSLLIQYRCGLEIFREWICLDHIGYAGQKAMLWWNKRFGKNNARRGERVNNALSLLFLKTIIMEYTNTITVTKDGKYKKIIGYNKKE